MTYKEWNNTNSVVKKTSSYQFHYGGCLGEHHAGFFTFDLLYQGCGFTVHRWRILSTLHWKQLYETVFLNQIRDCEQMMFVKAKLNWGIYLSLSHLHFVIIRRKVNNHHTAGSSLARSPSLASPVTNISNLYGGLLCFSVLDSRIETNE
jgi:hypothetical protein